MNFNYRTFYIKDLIEIYSQLYLDERGYFFESFNKDRLWKLGIPTDYVQDNVSYSTRGTLRGLHFQKYPYQQGKLVRVLHGRIMDVAVDLRKDSPTFGKYLSLILDSNKNNALYIPKGFAHGFLALEDSFLHYKCTDYYNPHSESGIFWKDPTLNIDWIENPAQISPKDARLPLFKDIDLAPVV